MGVGNGMFRFEIGSGFEDPGGTPPPRISRSTPPGCKVLCEFLVVERRLYNFNIDAFVCNV